MLRWMPSNIRFQIKAEKKEITDGLLAPFKYSFLWTMFSKPAGAARPFRTLT